MGGIIMAQARRSSENIQRRQARQRPEYIAAVRFKDGGRRLFLVSNAVDDQEARQMVMDELSEVASVVVALH